MHRDHCLQAETLLTSAGRDPAAYGGYVNTPAFRGSTILASSYAAWEAAKQSDNPYCNYGRYGSPTTRALEEAIAELEGGYRAHVFPSGLSACTHALLAFLSCGDHVLITDNVYGPTRSFADHTLRRLGVEVEYFDPLIGAGIAQQMRPNTRVVFVESPGSLTFEVCDIPAIAAVAHAHEAIVIADNSWASPLYFKPFAHGVDISIQAATKYILGHSDGLLGIATCNERTWTQFQASTQAFGETAGPEEVYLALRGLRTLSVRLKQHWHNGLALAQALAAHPAVARVLHPALPGAPGYEVWQRDFLGASGLFAIVLHSQAQEDLPLFFEHLKLFGIGLSWGGFESLALPVGIPARSAQAWGAQGHLIRIHAGLENAEDLIADMCHALDQLCTGSSGHTAQAKAPQSLAA